MKTNIIKREASDKTKGFRLQKMRAIRLMLDELNNVSKKIFYTAIENVEDVSHTTIDQFGVAQYYEEDKNYVKGKNFTLFTDAVKNTLVSFFDIYIGNWNSSESVNLGFYTTASIGNESKKLCADGDELLPPEKPILELLSSKSALSSDTLRYIKEALLQEYRAQYENKKISGNIDALESIDDNALTDFFNKIIWYFGSEDEKELKKSVVDSIKKSPFYTIRHANKEEIIFSLLMEHLDERQASKDLVQKVVFSPEVELIFKQAESEVGTDVMDPVWVHLEETKLEITDKRSLQEKIESVCPDYPPLKTKMHARLACRSKTEQAEGNKSFLSLKYRIFEACVERMTEVQAASLDEATVDSVIKELKKLSAKYVAELQKNYTYTISNKAAINGIVMDLFDGCYIAFDESTANE